MHIHIYIYISIYICIERERDRGSFNKPSSSPVRQVLGHSSVKFVCALGIVVPSCWQAIWKFGNLLLPAGGPRGGGVRRGAPWGGRGGVARRGARGREAPKDFTKLQQTKQSPDRQYKDPDRLYKAPEYYTKPTHIRQRHEILNNTLQH